MTQFTMLELLTKAGQSSRLHDGMLTRRIAAGLRAKGFRLKRIGNKHVWTNETSVDKEALAEQILEVVK